MSSISGFEIVKDEELKRYKISRGMVRIPVRGTTFSAGYDFISPSENITIQPGEIRLIPTGVKVNFGKLYQEVYYLSIVPRSGTSIKKDLRIVNSPGTVDADYYENPKNDGHIFVALKNESGVEQTVQYGERFAQGIITKYHTFNDVIGTKRTGGFGSTDENRN